MEGHKLRKESEARWKRAGSDELRQSQRKRELLGLSGLHPSGRYLEMSLCDGLSFQPNGQRPPDNEQDGQTSKPPWVCKFMNDWDHGRGTWKEVPCLSSYACPPFPCDSVIQVRFRWAPNVSHSLTQHFPLNSNCGNANSKEHATEVKQS